jgi:putative hydroxymethylpyrimidine transport system substrate-binding protein
VTFFPEDHGMPNFSELILVTDAKKSHDQRLSRFLAAIKKAVAYLDDHPKETWKQFAKAYPYENTAINREAWLTTLPYFAEDPAAFDSKEMLEFAAFMQKNHLIKTIQPASRYGVIIN